MIPTMKLFSCSGVLLTRNFLHSVVRKRGFTKKFQSEEITRNLRKQYSKKRSIAKVGTHNS